MTNVPWAERAAAAQAANRELLPKEYLLSKLPSKDERNVQYFAAQCGLLSAKELEITESPEITGLLAKLADGTYSAVEVTTAFIKRAVIAQQVCNPLAETLFDQALVRAQELDDHLAKTGKTVGPLHGLPISLKDQIDVKGVNHTMSYVARIGEKADKDAVITEILLKQGAVLYCKTIMSQGLWFGEGYNNVHGRVLNPYNRDLTSGGSSGGEGALVGFRGSLLGVGSDIGGSVRIPAAFSGVYGLRGSYGRIPYANASNSGEGQESVRSILGPITTSIDGLKTFYKAVLDAKPWDLDPWTPRMPWSEEAYQLRDHGGKGAKLCFAIMWDDGVVKPMPPYKRALEMTKKALLAAGHEVVDWLPYKAEEAIALLGRTFVADGSKEIKKQTSFSGEPILTQVLDLTLPELSTSEYFALCHRRTAFIKEALDHWNATVSQTSTGRPVDAIILPASAHAPIKHDDGMYIGYTGYGNLTDWTASVFPVTQVQPKVDVVEGAWAFRNKYDESVHKSYEPEVYRDAPISLQCMGRKYEEEAVIKMTEIIAEALAA